MHGIAAGITAEPRLMDSISDRGDAAVVTCERSALHASKLARRASALPTFDPALQIHLQVEPLLQNLVEANEH